MNVIMIQSRFESPVVTGRKLHTIRPHRRDGRPRARVGETLSIRVWTAIPYRSKQREIARVVVTSVEGVAIHKDGLEWRPGGLAACFWHEQRREKLLRSFAWSDGFANWPELKAWFHHTHGLPFEGSLIRWRLDPREVGAAGGGVEVGVFSVHDEFGPSFLISP